MGNPPKENDDFARLFEEMADLLQFTLENADKPLKDEMPKDLEARLSQLEKDVEAFCELNATLIEQEKGKGKGAEGTEHLTKKEKQVLDRTKNLVEKAEEKQEELSKVKPEKIIEDKDRRKHIKRMSRKKI